MTTTYHHAIPSSRLGARHESLGSYSDTDSQQKQNNHQHQVPTEFHWWWYSLIIIIAATQMKTMPTPPATSASYWGRNFVDSARAFTTALEESLKSRKGSTPIQPNHWCRWYNQNITLLNVLYLHVQFVVWCQKMSVAINEPFREPLADFTCKYNALLLYSLQLKYYVMIVWLLFSTLFLISWFQLFTRMSIAIESTIITSIISA